MNVYYIECSITSKEDRIHFDTITIETEKINENRIYKGIRLHITALNKKEGMIFSRALKKFPCSFLKN